MTALAVVVEDGADGEQFLQRAVEAAGFLVRARRSPEAVIDTLHRIDPLLAVVDWHVGEPRQVSEVLSLLAERHPATVVIVVSRDLGDRSARWAISMAHPGALIHDRQAEPDSLGLRIRGVLGRPFGDLIIRGGVAVHIPCSHSFRHPAAARLVAARGRPVRTGRNTAASQALWRFQKFLEAHGSTVRVAPHHPGSRHLIEAGTLPGCEGHPSKS